jgi:membrane protein
MAREGTAAEKAATAPDPDHPSKPESPPDLHRASWSYSFKSAWAEFNRDHCTDIAASLTYYSVLSVFPALLALVSLLGVFGQGESTVNAMLDLLKQVGQSDVANSLRPTIATMVQARGAGLTLAAGIAGALWSASGYVGAFGRAMNRVYDVDEGRPVWKLRPLQLVITMLLLTMAAFVLVGLVISGPVAASVGKTIGLADASVTLWNWAKWPAILAVVILMVAVLYYWTPNVQQPKFRWMSVGAASAILVWILASLAFGFYVSRFSSYNKTYGALAGVIVFLLWLWLTNLALMFGAELDAELERARQLQAGIKAEKTLQLPPRDTRQSEKAEEKLEKRIQEGRELRIQSVREERAEGRYAAARDGERGAGEGPEEEYPGADRGLEPLPSDRPEHDRRAPEDRA